MTKSAPSRNITRKALRTVKSSASVKEARIGLKARLQPYPAQVHRDEVLGTHPDGPGIPGVDGATALDDLLKVHANATVQVLALQVTGEADDEALSFEPPYDLEHRPGEP
jgi:hypothetical protein